MSSQQEAAMNLLLLSQKRKLCDSSSPSSPFFVGPQLKRARRFHEVVCASDSSDSNTSDEESINSPIEGQHLSPIFRSPRDEQLLRNLSKIRSFVVSSDPTARSTCASLSRYFKALAEKASQPKPPSSVIDVSKPVVPSVAVSNPIARRVIAQSHQLVSLHRKLSRHQSSIHMAASNN